MTTLKTLDARAAAMAVLLSSWLAKADTLVSAKVADARAHSGRALTATLRDTPDGRATAAKAKRSPSYGAAISRLDELSADLVSLIADARAKFYVNSLDWHALHVPKEWLRARPFSGSDAGISWARGVAVHNMPLVTEARNATDRAAIDLQRVLGQAASRAMPVKAADDLLDDWERRAARSIGMTARSLLSDSQIIIDRKAGRDVVRPEMLDDDPTLPKG